MELAGISELPMLISLEDPGIEGPTSYCAGLEVFVRNCTGTVEMGLTWYALLDICSAATAEVSLREPMLRENTFSISMPAPN